MAKDKRFPSPANVAVDKKGLPLAPKAPAPAQVKEVVGKRVDLVQVHYKGKNNHILHTQAHALAPGLNHVPRDVMNAEMKHPAMAQLVKDGAVSIAWGDEVMVQESACEQESEDEESAV